LIDYSKNYLKLKLVEGVSFLGGFEAGEPKTSGFFKLQKICTLEKDIPRKSFSYF
jgi:hypothetical protein